MIDVKALCFAFDERVIFDQVSFGFEKAGLFGIIGPNGAGKSTLLKLILGFLKPDDGDICINGQSVSHMKRRDLAKEIAYVPQHITLDYDFTVMDILEMGRHPYHGQFDTMTRKERDLIDEAIEATGLSHLTGHSVTTLSGGEMQRLLIGRALVQDTPVILLDEPISHLDIHYQKEIVNLLSTIGREKGKIIISVLHDMNVALNYCEGVFLVHEGTVISGQADEVITPERIEAVYKTKVHLIESDARKVIYW